MKTIFENVIARGNYDLPGLLKKIDSYHIEGKLSDDDRDALYVLARDGAKTENGVDVMAKLVELEGRVKALEEAGATDAGGETAAPEEYIPGKWYRGGDRVTFEGAAYTCTAPDGQVCTWSPYEYPAYWSKDEAKEG